MLKWVPSDDAKRDSARNRARMEEEAKREWERKERTERQERQWKKEEDKKARAQHAEKIMAEVMMKAECDRWDQHVRSLQKLKPKKYGCWGWPT